MSLQQYNENYVTHPPLGFAKGFLLKIFRFAYGSEFERLMKIWLTGQLPGLFSQYVAHRDCSVIQRTKYSLLSQASKHENWLKSIYYRLSLQHTFMVFFGRGFFY